MKSPEPTKSGPPFATSDSPIRAASQQFQCTKITSITCFPRKNQYTWWFCSCKEQCNASVPE
jgi:hypothetical protein